MQEPPKDIMKGWRVYPDPSDPEEIRHKFGYEDLVLRRRARQWLEVQDVENLEDAVQKAIYAYHANKPTYREISQANSARWKWESHQQWLKGETTRGGLTKPEAELLVEHFAGANDPVAQSLYAKAAALLENNDD